MKKRLITAGVLIAMVACFFVMQAFFAISFDILILAISLIAAFEVANLQDKSGKVNYKIVPAIFSIFAFVATVLCVVLKWNALVLFSIFVGGMVVAFVATYFIPFMFKGLIKENSFRQISGMGNKSFSLFKTVNTMSIIVYPVFLAYFMYFLNHITELGFNTITTSFAGARLGMFALLLVMAITCLTDTMAFFVGTLLKGPKLCPKISPNKTISGAIGGLVGGIVGAVVLLAIFRAIYPTQFALIPYWEIVIVGFFGAIVSQCGDLFESYLKRKAKVKDAGDILPGHGGVMDRVDAMLFNTPYIFVCIVLMLA